MSVQGGLALCGGERYRIHINLACALILLIFIGSFPFSRRYLGGVLLVTRIEEGRLPFPD